MNYVGINIWDIFSLELEFKEIKRINQTKYDKVIYFSQHEYLLNPGRCFHIIKENCKNKGISLELLLGCNSYPEKELRMFDLTNVNITYWNTFFLLESYYNLSKYSIPINDTDYDYHYIFMNRTPRDHRCKTIDILCNENLLNLGAISWINPIPNYQWKCFHNKKMTLGQDKVSIESQYNLPKEYYSSFCQLICETVVDEPLLLSEKTAIPLILGKPFVAISSLGYHKFLQKLGFELYTEIFDYSFDDDGVIDNRIQGAVQNISNICKTPSIQLKSLYKKVHEKIEYNKNRAREIIFDKDKYPALVNEIIDHYLVTGEKVDNRLIDMYLGLQSLDYKY